MNSKDNGVYELRDDYLVLLRALNEDGEGNLSEGRIIFDSELVKRDSYFYKTEEFALTVEELFHYSKLASTIRSEML